MEELDLEFEVLDMEPVEFEEELAVALKVPFKCTCPLSEELFKVYAQLVRQYYNLYRTLTRRLLDSCSCKASAVKALRYSYIQALTCICEQARLEKEAAEEAAEEDVLIVEAA